MKLATTAALGAFRRVYNDPWQVEGGAVIESRATYFRLLWAYYDNSAFENIALWAPYRSQYRLYRQIRSLYNPTRRLVDFYAGQVYPGVLSEDGKDLPDGVDLAIPLADDTPPELKAAIAQFWRWSNWQSNKSVLTRYGSITGNVLVEVDDNLDLRTVAARIIWPSLLADLDLTPAGDVKSYAIQYFALDDNGFRYTYRKEVDANEYRFYKDDKPYDYGDGASYPNPYGFVPAVWIKHRDLGGDYGAPAIHGSLGKIDEVNSLASHIHDQVHKVIAAPMVLATDGGISNLFGQQAQAKRPPTNALDVTDLDREGLLLLKGPADLSIQSLAGNLPLADAVSAYKELLTEIEADHPELAFYRELRSMSQLTGPAANRVMGDVALNVQEAAANYDAGSMRLFGMAVAIAGWRANRGDWWPLTAQQQAFRPFDLDAYTNGELHFSIMPRPLIVPTAMERVQIEQAQTALEQQKANLAQTAIAVREE